MHKKPFDGNPVQLYQKIVNEDFEHIPAGVFDTDISAIIHLMLEKDPVNRISVLDIMKKAAVLRFADQYKLLNFFPASNADIPPSTMDARRRLMMKVVAIGDTEVGKSSLFKRFANNTFSLQHNLTIGSDFLVKDMIVDNNLITVQMWDTAGLEKYRSLGTAFYRGADACFLVCDVTRPESLEHLDRWREDFLLLGTPPDPDTFPFALLANKIDLNDTRQVGSDQLQHWCSSKGQMPCFETSARDNMNIESAFNNIVRRAYPRYVFPKEISRTLKVNPDDEDYERVEGKRCLC